MRETLTDFFLPVLCAGCRAPMERGANFCEDCAQSLICISNFRCSVCGARAPEGKTCHSGSLSILSATRFDLPGVAELVHRLKFSRATSAAPSVGTILAAALLKHPDIIRGASLVPIPLSRKRLKERGYNQAHLIAAVVSETTGLPLLLDALVRTRDTEAQTLLSPDKREENVADAFAVTAAVSGKKIILIDDVTTTGATLLAAARTLRLAHARPVVAAVFAAAASSRICPPPIEPLAMSPSADSRCNG